jgi:hypothetical protein
LHSVAQDFQFAFKKTKFSFDESCNLWLE